MTEALKHWAPLIIRLVLGVIFIAHGSQKLLGWFGGPGLSGTIEFLQQNLGIPPFLTVLNVIAEFFGGIALIIGLLTRIASLGIAIVMLVAIFKVHLPNGFFMNWFNEPNVGHGIEMNLALLAMAVSLMLSGAGNLSLDGLLWGGKKQGG